MTSRPTFSWQKEKKGRWRQISSSSHDTLERLIKRKEKNWNSKLSFVELYLQLCREKAGQEYTDGWNWRQRHRF